MRNPEILQQLREFKAKASSQYGIKRIGVFGSYAEDRETDESDIDIVVELDAPDLFKLVHIKEELESLLGKKVDVVRNRPRMNSYLKRQIEEKAVYV